MVEINSFRHKKKYLSIIINYIDIIAVNLTIILKK